MSNIVTATYLQHKFFLQQKGAKDTNRGFERWYLKPCEEDHERSPPPKGYGAENACHGDHYDTATRWSTLKQIDVK